MSKLQAGLGANAGTIGTVVVVTSVLALGVWIGNKREAAEGAIPAALMQPQDKDTPQADAASASDPVTAPETQAAPQSDVADATDTAPQIAPEDADTLPVTDDIATADTPVDIAPPAFDEVRREADGMTVIAGRAAPGAPIQLLRDGVEIATTTADGSGKFATLVMIAPDGQGHVLSLSQRVDGTDMASADEIILAPTKAPVESASDEGRAEDVDQNAQADAVESTTETVAVDRPADPSTATQETSETQNLASDSAPVTPDAAQAPVETVTATPVEGQPVPAVPTATIDAETTVTEIATTETTATETVAAETTVTETIVPISPVPVSEPANPPSPPDVAVLKSTAEGVELLNPAAPEVMDNVALDTISYSDAGDVQLAGRAQPETQTVRVYLDNAAVITLPVDGQGRWRGDVPDVDEGIYTLRLDEVDAEGTVTSRVETPFKRESSEALSQATARQDGPIKAITVQTGATLWAIARDRYGDGKLYVRVFKANEGAIRDPDLIYPGQIFDLPD